MSSQWRGGPKVKGTLGTLLRTTMHQVGVVKDAAVRQARTQRVWIDSAVLARRRKELLAQLGEQLVERVRSGAAGELDARWPELAASVEELDQLEAELDEATARSRDAVPAVSAAWARAKAGRSAPPPRRPEDLRVWRPVLDDDEPAVSATEVSAGEATPAPDPAERGRRRRARFSAGGQGGISFGDDDDLAQYMHEDDVPKPEPTR
jgi:hypothetical protein